MHIKRIMKKYNRASGWVDVITVNSGKQMLEFFDSNPKLNNCNALFVTKQDVENYSNNY